VTPYRGNSSGRSPPQPERNPDKSGLFIDLLRHLLRRVRSTASRQRGALPSASGITDGWQVSF
jgi:hypothetical protein